MSSVGRRWPADPALRARDERLEALKAVIGKLAHDFNNFLAPQYGYLTMLKDEVPSGSTVSTYLGAMNTAAQRAESYLGNILLGMRPYRQFSPREFSLNGLLEESLRQWAAELPAGKEVRLSKELEGSLYCGDEKQWRVAFEQLLSNARYALAMGGELDVTLRHEKLDGDEVERLGLSTDEIFRIRIRDSGFGMSAEAVGRAFEPFYTTRTAVKAAGLGLTIAHGITQLHGGQIDIQSVEDKGTIVTISLPKIMPPQRYGSFSYDNIQRARKVLLIEDDPLIKEVLRSWITRGGLEVDSATNETEARRALERSGQQCVLVLCEADLQSGNGEELFAKLAPSHPHPTWVFLSGARKPAFSAEEDSPLVIQKPFSHYAFSDLLRKYAQS